VTIRKENFTDREKWIKIPENAVIGSIGIGNVLDFCFSGKH